MANACALPGDFRDELLRLITAHEPQIRGFIGRRSGPKVLESTTVDDLYQETVAKALRGAGTFVFTSGAHFFGWICVVASRVISDSLRGQPKSAGNFLPIRHGCSSGVGVSESSLPHGGRTPSSIVAGGERSGTLQAAIAALPPRYYTVLTLYKLEEQSLGDVAARLGLTKNATARLLERALKALKGALKDKLVDR